MHGIMTGAKLDGTKVGNKRTTLPQAHFHWEVWMSVPPVVRSGLNGEMNLDTVAAVNTYSWNFGQEEAGDGRFCRTASGERIADGGAWQFQGYDENGLLRSLSGRLTGVHRVLCSAAVIACKGRQDFNLDMTVDT